MDENSVKEESGYHLGTYQLVFDHQTSFVVPIDCNKDEKQIIEEKVDNKATLYHPSKKVAYLVLFCFNHLMEQSYSCLASEGNP